ncbi:MAG: M48 family metalloprotease [Halofilum sp. (in: g-proteobacteria)]
MIPRIATLLLLAAVTGGPAASASELPSMGEPVDQVLSPRQEAEVGRELMARARRTLDLNHDPEIAAYIDSVGRRLASHSDSTPVNGYTFFVVRHRSINAFAGPGGYIGVHSGLILEADSEAELAGVMAHEIAHVSQRHIARSLARSQRDSYATLAAILAGLVIGSQNPQAGQAAVTGGIAADAQRRIDYTRSNEYEADRIGIALLARAGYAPDGMTGFFEKLMRASGSDSSQVPEFLRTHPLSQNRISEAASRADALKRPEQRRDTLTFQLMKARIEAEYSDQPGRLHDRWRQREPADDENVEAARQYGLAVLELRLDRPERARERLDELYSGASDNLHYGLALARAIQASGDGDKAITTWENTQVLHPDSYPMVATGTELLLANDQADQAVELVTDYLRGDGPIQPEAWRLLAEAADAAGRPGRSHEALGEYYVQTDRLEQALTQLEIALKRAESGSTEHTRLSTRVEQVRELRQERLANDPLDR